MRKTLICAAVALCGASAALAQGQPADPFRAACEQAAAHLAAGKFKEAAAALEPALKEAAASKGPSRDLVFYYYGCAAVAAGDDNAAGRALARLAPFENAELAAHARYLLGRIHHRAGELTEALQHYDAVAPAFDKQPAAAKKGPDFASEALFHSGVLLYEQKKFSEALPRFELVLKRDRAPAWIEEARLRMGICHVRMNQGAEAAKLLQFSQDHPRLARQSRWWIAQALLRAAEPKPADAAAHLRKAAAAAETDAGPPQAEILLALGDALERAGRPAEAVEVYKPLLGSKGEEILARLAGAHAAARQYREADETASRFEKEYPGSPLLGDVLLRRADMAFVEAQGGKGDYAEVVRRYERILATVSGPAAHAARYRTALAQYRLGRFGDAVATLRAIPEQDRTGELGGAHVLQAECLLRGALPSDRATDAVTAARLLKDYQEAAELLGKYSGLAQDPEAMMKLGQALRESAALLADPAERAAVATKGRELYENFRAAFPNHALRPTAEYERANCYALAGDPATAIQKLERFKAAPFVDTPVAPLALLRQAQLFRAAGQPAQAVAILTECRTRHEAALLKDPARLSWVPLLRYHHGAALKEAKQAAEAAKILESVVKEHAGSEWAEPSSRLLKELKP